MQSESNRIQRRLRIMWQIALLLLHSIAGRRKFERQTALRQGSASDQSHQGLCDISRQRRIGKSSSSPPLALLALDSGATGFVASASGKSTVIGG